MMDTIFIDYNKTVQIKRSQFALNLQNSFHSKMIAYHSSSKPTATLNVIS